VLWSKTCAAKDEMESQPGAKNYSDGGIREGRVRKKRGTGRANSPSPAGSECVLLPKTALEIYHPAVGRTCRLVSFISHRMTRLNQVARLTLSSKITTRLPLGALSRDFVGATALIRIDSPRRLKRLMPLISSTAEPRGRRISSSSLRR